MMSQITVEYINHCGSDLSVANAARVSFDKVSELSEDGSLKTADVKLINYLAKHKHFSPFNHSFISVRVKAPLFVCRQLVKHKFMPYNEVSRRYVTDKPEFYTPDSWRQAAENVKQGSSDVAVDISPLLEMETADGNAVMLPDEVNTIALQTYEALLKQGVCAEEARMVLPQSMMSTFIWSGTLGAFCDMLVLRLDPHTQYESRLVAQQVAEIVKGLFPVSYKALVEK